MHRKLAHKTAVKFAKDLEGPLGRIPFERVVEKHIAFFDELRSEGASWPQIADLLAGAGVSRKDGQPMAASQLRATVSRISAPERRENLSEQSIAQIPHKFPSRTPTKSKPNLASISRGKQSIRQKMHRASQARKTTET